MTKEELHTWKRDFYKTFMRSHQVTQVGKVWFYQSGASITAQYQNGRWILFPDNGYLGPDNYYPLVKVNPFFSDEVAYSTKCEPSLEAVAAGIIRSWKLFTGS